MKYCFDTVSAERNSDFLVSLKDIYETGFPDANEREDFGVILKRVTNPAENDPHTIILLETVPEKTEVAGGLIADWYANSKALHLIYLIVSENHREKGIAKKLVENGVPWIKEWIAKEKGIEIGSVFFESNIPWKTCSELDNFDTELRLRIFSKMGAKLIDIPYIQPALDSGKKEVDNLFLLSFQQFNKTDKGIPESDIAAFLTDLYKSLGIAQPDGHPSFKKMMEALQKTKSKEGLVQLNAVPTELEIPSHEFGCVSVTFHFVEGIVSEESSENVMPELEYCRHFSSFERDLLNFQNQKNLPFATVLAKPNLPAILVLPGIYSYVSEGKVNTLLSERNETDVRVSVSYSLVRLSNRRIWHLTVSPAKEKFFTEYDIIKLSSLFGSSQEKSTAKHDLRFRLAKPGETNLKPADFVKEIADLSEKVLLRPSGSGIVEIDSTKFSLNLESFYEIFTLQERTFFPDEKTKQLAKAVCGILLGIFDFNRMDEEEIFDTIQPLMPSELSLMVLCRGTLFKISENDEIMKTVSESILVSPYLLIPSAVLAYNEDLLIRAKNILTESLSEKKKTSLKSLETGQATVTRFVNYIYLEDLFQYPTENLIVKQGNSQRGLTTLKLNIQNRLTELKSKIESKRSNFTLFTDSVIALVLFLIALWEFYKNFSDNLVPMYAVSVIVVAVYIYIVIKKRT